jgi:hypothetical protein
MRPCLLGRRVWQGRLPVMSARGGIPGREAK